MTEIKLPMTPCILWQDQGTDSPNSHSLSHKWLAELFVPISQNGWSMPINQTWPNFIQASFLPPSPWTLTYPWAMEGEQPLFNDPFQNKLASRKNVPWSTVQSCHPHPMFTPLCKKNVLFCLNFDMLAYLIVKVVLPITVFFLLLLR